MKHDTTGRRGFLKAAGGRRGGRRRHCAEDQGSKKIMEEVLAAL